MIGQATVDRDLAVHGGSREGIVPVQLMFCLKEQNKKKLDSHKWLFRAFAPMLNPYVCVLIDVGTRPRAPNAIYNLWKAFDRNSNIAGACGEICVLLGDGCKRAKNIMQPLVAAQNFEYKVLSCCCYYHHIDLPDEQYFGQDTGKLLRVHQRLARRILGSRNG
jgi:chitin synthase